MVGFEEIVKLRTVKWGGLDFAFDIISNGDFGMLCMSNMFSHPSPGTLS